MVSPPLGLAKGGKSRAHSAGSPEQVCKRLRRRKSAAEVLSRSQETRPGARGSGPGRGGRGFGLRPILQARVKFTRPAPFLSVREGRGQDGNAARESAQAPEARAPGRVFPEAFGGGAAERERLRACRRRCRRRRGSFFPLLLCEGKGASPFHGLRPLRAPLRVFQAAATALGKLAVLSLVSE